MFSPVRLTPLARRALVIVLGLVLPAVATTASVARSPSLPRGLSTAERTRLGAVAETASLAVRLQAEAFPARPEIFEYLLDHPEFATHVTRALKLARYRIWRTGDGLQLDDGWGTRGRFEVVHAGSGVRVMYARGQHEQRWLPNIGGEAVVVFEYGFAPGPDGSPRVTPAIGSFVKLDSGLLTVASRIVGPYARDKAEKEARRLAKVFMRVSRAIAENPARVYDLVRQRPDVPARDLEGFRRLLDVPTAAAR